MLKSRKDYKNERNTKVESKVENNNSTIQDKKSIYNFMEFDAYYSYVRAERTKGKMARKEWVWIKDKCYCLDEHGVLYVDCITPDGYKVDKNGAWIKE